MRKKIIVVVLILTLAFVMTGCDSSVYLYYVPSDEGAYYVADFRIGNAELELINNSAKSGVKYSDYQLDDFESLSGNFSFEVYLKTLMRYRSAFEYVGASDSGLYTTFSFETIMPVEADDDDLLLTTKRTDEAGLFFNYYNFTGVNPMTEFRAKYDTASSSVIGSTPMSILQNGWIESQLVATDNYPRQNELEAGGWVKSPEIKNGYLEYKIKFLPSLKEAFPVFANKSILDPDKLKLIYCLQTNAKLKTSGESALYDSMGNTYYSFTELFLGEPKNIEYQMRRANTISWNVLSIMLGFMTVGVIILVSRFIKTKAQKPKKTNSIIDFIDRLPYNPNEDNPFDGY